MKLEIGAAVLSTQTLQNSIEEAAQAVRTRETELNSAQGALAEAERELRLLARSGASKLRFRSGEGGA